MFALVLAAENDETRQTVSFLIACLIGIAIALAVLTVWYWFYTDPKRRREPMPLTRSESELLELSTSIAPRPVPSFDVQSAPTDGQRRVLAEDDGGAKTPARADAIDGDEAHSDEFVTGPLMARQTWDFVAAAKRAEGSDDRPVRTPTPAAPRIAVPSRPPLADADQDEADELAVIRRRREREAARGLSDEVWDSVRRSVFDKLDG